MLINCLAACAHLAITVSEIERDIGENSGRKVGFFIPPLHSTPPLGGFPSEYRHPLWGGKTRMVSLPGGEKISNICLFVLTWSTNVTDRWTDGRTDRHCMTEKTALASHRAVKTMTIMLNRFHLIPECHGRTDGQTDRQTDRQTDGWR